MDVSKHGYEWIQPAYKRFYLSVGKLASKLRATTITLDKNHRLSVNRPTKRGREKSPSDGQCQCEKEMAVYSLACR
jgi:hypothetical protein